MLGISLPLVLLGASTSWAAPAAPSPGTVVERADSTWIPPNCIPEIWIVYKFCILAPPTTTIKPSDKRADSTIVEERVAELEALMEARGDVTPDPTPTTGTCIPTIWDAYKICIIAPPITTIGPSTKNKRDFWFPGGAVTGPIIPDKTIPGGQLIPDKTIPGGPLVPEPYIPGGEITPSN